MMIYIKKKERIDLCFWCKMRISIIFTANLRGGTILI